MISDTLAIAAAEIRNYLSWPDTYTGAMSRRIEVLVKQMDTIRKELEGAPWSAVEAKYPRKKRIPRPHGH